jgi:nucleoside-diphosphate-sugar epimerase
LRVLITGGGGMLGQLLARALLAGSGLAPGAREHLEPLELVLLDQAFPPTAVRDARSTQICGDVLEETVAAQAFAGGIDVVVHLAAVVSAGAEADFDLGLRVNLDGLRLVLGKCRELGSRPRVVFASSVAAFGGALPEVVTDTTAATPQSSYGTQKVIGELLVSDMTRKGYIDGRSVRLPTIVVRPGKPNRAASGFMSNILREPLAGESAVCPVSADTRMWILSPEGAVRTLLHALRLSADDWGWQRTLNAPGLTVSVVEALAALGRVAGDETVARVRFERDPAIERIVTSWPARFSTDRAHALGFHADASIEAIIHAHIAASGR